MSCLDLTPQNILSPTCKELSTLRNSPNGGNFVSRNDSISQSQNTKLEGGGILKITAADAV